MGSVQLAAYRHASGEHEDGECRACIDDCRWSEHDADCEHAPHQAAPEMPDRPLDEDNGCGICGHSIERDAPTIEMGL